MFNSIDNFKFIFTEISKWNHFQCNTAMIIATIMFCTIAIICLTVIHCNSEKERTKRDKIFYESYNDMIKNENLTYLELNKSNNDIIKNYNSTYTEVNKSNNDVLSKNLKNQKKTDK